MKLVRPLDLLWGENARDGGVHEEWHAPCGCAYHPEPHPHVHPCGRHRPSHEARQRRLIGDAQGPAR